MSTTILHLGSLSEGYLRAKRVVIDHGFEDEIRWQLFRTGRSFGEQDFLREASWVVLSAGLSAHAVKAVFPKLSQAFFEWESAWRIVEDRRWCKKRALDTFRHLKKVDAIIRIADLLVINGLTSYCEAVTAGDPTVFYELPYLGPATAAHLMKNLGAPMAKPDRHLKRIAKSFHYGSAAQMCNDIAHSVGDSVAEVDIVLWRYATLDRNYLEQLGRPLARLSEV